MRSTIERLFLSLVRAIFNLVALMTAFAFHSATMGLFSSPSPVPTRSREEVDDLPTPATFIPLDLDPGPQPWDNPLPIGIDPNRDLGGYGA